ncbi:MAG: GNAT family N-acetyltransferase [Spirochaetales bacterium]|jgi:GNAT superfamily N-acetyltransferase
MQIKKLCIENIPDWLEFFDDRAFKDHQEWKMCYCTYYFQPKPEEYKNIHSRKRNYAVWLIENGIMQGYLAYDDNKVIGWCNSNNKKTFPRLNTASDIDEKSIKSIVCFIVEKEYRNKGVATALLQQLIKDAKEEGYKVVEAYPNKSTQSSFFNYHGAYEMYIKNGFIEDTTTPQTIVRKYF